MMGSMTLIYVLCLASFVLHGFCLANVVHFNQRSWNKHQQTIVKSTGKTTTQGSTEKGTPTAPVTHLNKPVQHPFKDCHGYWLAGERNSGVYTIYPNGTYPTQVFCNITQSKGYTVIQRRMIGNENFNRPWVQYKTGFGNTQGDFWAGLDTIHYLTITGNNKLRIDLQDWFGNRRYIEYKQVTVLEEAQYYRLMMYGKVTGNVPDDMSFNNGMYFYTSDRPDINYCAVHMKCGWWFNYCSYALPNGFYYHGGHYVPSGSYYDGIYWKDWWGYDYSLKYVSMTLSSG